LVLFALFQKKLKTFYSKEIILLKPIKQSNKQTMSSISKIVNILSAKYGFDIKEATEHVKAEIQTYKNLTKEEKDAIKEAEKKAKADAKQAEKKAKADAKQAEKQAKKAEKPKAPRSTAPAKDAKVAPKPENNKYFVTFHNADDPDAMSYIEKHCQFEFMDHVQQITHTDVVPLCASNLSDYAKFIKTHPDDEFDSVWFCNGQPSQMNYTFVFQDQEYQVKYHKF
jgi:chemotaxis protein histidine kinase CheA